MKKLLSSAVFLFAMIIFAGAQNLNVSGHITDDVTGDPIQNHHVLVSVLAGGMYQNYEFYTNDAGFYGSDSIPAASQGLVRAGTFDRIGEEHAQEAYFNPNNYSFVFDFDICNDSIPQGDCENWFNYETWNNIDFTFIGESMPPANAYFWDFGDGSTATGQMATHSYNMNDLVYVTLTTIAYNPATGDSCVATSTQEIWAGTGGGNCIADFDYTIDSVPTGAYVVQFTDLSIGNPTFWMWNFGDGDYSEEQNPEHTYYEQGTYYVCLTIFGDSMNNCYDTYCEEIVIGSGGGGDCQNWFWYDTWNFLTFDFYGESYPFPANDYVWDFGDGETGYGQVVNHTYDPGNGDVFLVTLTTYSYIPGTVDTCVATSMQEVWVGGQGNDCENWFWYESYGDFTYDFFGESFPFPADEYLWDFGDGNFASGQQVTHTFDPTLGDEFLVCLTTYSYNPVGDSCIAESCQEIFLSGQMGHELFGTVMVENAPVDFALVGLFGMDNTGAYIFDFTMTDEGTGAYFFEDVPDGDYYIWASLLPMSEYYFQYFPTYFGDALFWFDAVLITLGQPANPYDINLIPVESYGAGPGNITGTISFDNGKGPGDNVNIVLMDEGENALTYLLSNEEGLFEFEDIAYGTYKLKVEMPGVNSEIATVVLDQNNQTINVEFIVKGSSAFLSVSDLNMLTLHVGDIYPNPATNMANIDINMAENTDVQIHVFNQVGQEVYNMESSLIQGNQKLQFPVSDLVSGFYTIRISGQNGGTIMKKFIITK